MIRVRLTMKTASPRTIEGQLLESISPDTLLQAAELWTPLMEGEEDDGWDWTDFVQRFLCNDPDSNYRGYSLVTEGTVQGLMIAQQRDDLRSAENEGLSGVHVQRLATAPWNRLRVRDRFDKLPSKQRTRLDLPPRLVPVGRSLLVAAIGLSESLGQEGRLGWHSLNGARDDYSKMFPELIDLGIDAAEDLAWYEIDGKTARDFVENHRGLIISD